MLTDNIEEFSAYWTSPKIVLKCVGPKLVPFFKTVAIYFVLCTPSPCWFACLIKSLPVVCLCGFVLYHGMSLGEKHAYARRILLGLFFSCIGDIMLIWPCCFTWGMLSFAIAHLLYISAFGMKPLNPMAGMVCATAAVAGVALLINGCQGPYVILVPVYTFLLMIMVWRAVARVQLFEDLWTWTKLCSCGGGILFAISDFLLGMNMFHSPLPYANMLIMVTYYAAQLGIALSVVDNTSMAVISAAHSNDNTQCCQPLDTKSAQNKHVAFKENVTLKSLQKIRLKT
ncbi:lysoplasmalogenase-like protein TMEM86A [Uloborus diversus]|uniref:lysoplasmalogenase-like protein TMEM86A n=1 Tax=Uloborus diversus TaxID=327109 RepID=UPI002409099D|nr:lysoplasmalogenase-like protein TMEM86A [Uloborus diversus]